MNFFLTLSILLCLANVTNTRTIRYRGRNLFWLCSRNFGCFCTESVFNCAGSTKIRKFTAAGTTFFKQIYLGNTSITSLECVELPIGGVEILDIRHTLIEQRDACDLRRTCSRIKSLKFSGFCEPEDQPERKIGTSSQSESKTTFKKFGIKVNPAFIQGLWAIPGVLFVVGVGVIFYREVVKRMTAYGVTTWKGVGIGALFYLLAGSVARMFLIGFIVYSICSFVRNYPEHPISRGLMGLVRLIQRLAFFAARNAYAMFEPRPAPQMINHGPFQVAVIEELVQENDEVFFDAETGINFDLNWTWMNQFWLEFIILFFIFKFF